MKFFISPILQADEFAATLAELTECREHVHPLPLSVGGDLRIWIAVNDIVVYDGRVYDGSVGDGCVDIFVFDRFGLFACLAALVCSKAIVPSDELISFNELL